jgi:hypothetical protein
MDPEQTDRARHGEGAASDHSLSMERRSDAIDRSALAPGVLEFIAATRPVFARQLVERKRERDGRGRLSGGALQAEAA